MKEYRNIERRQIKNTEIRKLVDKAKKVCHFFFNDNYVYDNAEAVSELGLDEELIDDLLKDYIAQVIKTVSQMEKMIYTLQSQKDAKQELEYIELRNLAHKNIGVAKNLRIKDAISVLDDLMRKDDLEHLFLCIETLLACAIVLNPTYAYDTIRLIELKNTF